MLLSVSVQNIKDLHLSKTVSTKSDQYHLHEGEFIAGLVD